MPGTVTVPSTLSGHAADIWRKAFLSAYSSTCSERDDKDECAAKIAWAAVKNGYKKGKKGQWVAKADDPVIGPLSSEVDAQPPLAYDREVLKPGAGTKMQRWKAAYNKALAEDCRQSDNPTECARAYANKAVGRVETDVEPVVEKTHVIGRAVKRIIGRGGAGSGHHGHEGRPGEKGGSLPGKGGGKAGPKTTGTGFQETIGGKSSLSKSQRKKIRKNVFSPAGGGDRELGKKDKVRTVNTLAKFPLKELREMQEQQKKGPNTKHNQSLFYILSEAVNKREFPDEPSLWGLTGEEKSLSSRSFDPLGADLIKKDLKMYGRENGKKYPLITMRGGAGSGHYGHAGRIGEVGGSEPGSGGGGRVENPRDAKSATSDVFSRFGVSHGKMSARYVDFTDLARGGTYNVTVNDIDWQSWLDAGPQELKDALPSGMILSPKFVNLPEGISIISGDEGPEIIAPENYQRSALEKKLDGMRRHKFLTKALEKKLPALYSQEENPDPIAQAKWFDPTGNWTWYATEYDPQNGLFFGLVQGHDEELGYFSRGELAELQGRFGLPIERDLYFKPKPLSEIRGGGVLSGEGLATADMADVIMGPANPTEKSLRGEEAMDDPLKERREFDTAKRKKMAKSHTAMADGSFPIANCSDVTNALRSLGRTNKPRAKVVAHIRKRAKKLGCEMTPALKERMKMFDGYVVRAEVRKQLNDVDYALIERMGDQEIIRPDRFSSIAWRTMPPSKKNVRAEATRRIVERNYAQSVEDAQMAGWKAKINHYQPDEYYFTKSHDTEAGPILIRGVLVRRIDSVEWKLKPLSQFATDSIAVQLPDYLLRHNKEQLLKLPVLRGGSGSGHYGHAGRIGEVGGSEPGSGVGPQTQGNQTSRGRRGSTAMIFQDPLKREGFEGMGLLDKYHGTTEEGLEEWDVWVGKEKLRRLYDPDDYKKVMEEHREGEQQIHADFDFGSDEELLAMFEEVGMLEDAPDYIQVMAKEKEQEASGARAPLPERLPDMSLSAIAREIRKDWSGKGKGVNYAAKPYLDAMNDLESLDDMFFHDSGRSVVLYFLSNARTWRGETAKAVKAELNKRLKAGK